MFKMLEEHLIEHQTLSKTVSISSQKEILLKQGNHTRYEYNRLGFIEFVHVQ